MKSFQVDLRSDTVTTPSAAMRRAMAEAEVGDDWFGDDPTVHRLQERAAEITGKEAALYVPTGTMANQIALRLHFYGPGHLVAAEPMSHVASTEVMSAGRSRDRIPERPRRSAEAGCTRGPGPRGSRAGRTLRRRDRRPRLPSRTPAVMPAGTVMDVEDFRSIRKVAEEAGVAVHLTELGSSTRARPRAWTCTEYATEVDTLMFCVSKGLGAPIGSLLCGTAEQMREGRRIKILFGGALAAGGRDRGRRPGRARGGPQAPRTRTTSARVAWARPSPSSCPAAWIRPMLKRTWSSPTRKHRWR